MTPNELADLLLWLEASADVLTDAGYPATVHNTGGGIGLVVQTPKGIGGQWIFTSPVHVEQYIRAWASQLSVVLPHR